MPDDVFIAEGRASARPVFAKQHVQKHVLPGESKSRRKHPIHLPPGERHNRTIIIFVTTCTAKRRTILASPHVHEAIVSAWDEALTWLVGRYVVMPDHIHFFCAPNGAEIPSLERWMRYWKSILTKRIGAKKGDVWQRDLGVGNFGSRKVTAARWNKVVETRVRKVIVTNQEDCPT